MSGASFSFRVDLHYPVPLLSISPICHTLMSLLSTNERQGVHVKLKQVLQIYELNSPGLGSNTVLTVRSSVDKHQSIKGQFYCKVVI